MPSTPTSTSTPRSSSESPASASTAGRIARAPVALLLLLLMALGSVLLWIGIPLGVIWGASQIAASQQPGMGLYAGMAIVIPALMYLCLRLLRRLDLAFARVTGAERDEIYRPGWTRSMRGERTSQRRTTVLDVVMAVSVGLALLGLLVWFAAFAGSPLPS